jgi:hypothetical protein
MKGLKRGYQEIRQIFAFDLYLSLAPSSAFNVVVLAYQAWAPQMMITERRQWGNRKAVVKHFQPRSKQACTRILDLYQTEKELYGLGLKTDFRRSHRER